VALIVARLVPGRGHPELLQAWREVARRIPAARLLVAGRGELEAELRAHARRLSLQEQVRFIGYRRDLPEVYRAADLMVLLAPGNDGTCRAALEAMASGLAVLAGDRGALPEIVRPDTTGRVVPMSDPQALATALVELLLDPAALRRMGAQARSEAGSRFTLQRQLALVEGLYRRVLADAARC
jgi:glycosyltransferase involved in cell wall biosynthesis